MVDYVTGLQTKICDALAEIDGRGSFGSDVWERPGGGGGTARAISDGAIFEKAGVNVSVVHGDLPESLAAKMQVTESRFFATGISLVIHPVNPHIPTVHANLRYFENGNDDAWFGGGVDLTPYTGNTDAPQHFHTAMKSACDGIDPSYYPRFKQECDRYFYLRHRKESRGVGGIFYDYLRGSPETHFDLQQSIGDAFLGAYLPIVEQNRDRAVTERERSFQLLRRGRYVEFNLVYDRGTLFGLETDGRIESILMSLPPHASWGYDVDMETNDSEKRLMSWLRTPIDWVTS